MKKSKNKKLLKLATNYQPWDYGFNLEIEQEMFKKMYEYFKSDKPRVIDSSNIAKYALLATKLIDIIEENDSAINYYKGDFRIHKYINCKNCNRFVGYEIKNSPIRLNALRIEKAWYLYNKLRFNIMRKMWD